MAEVNVGSLQIHSFSNFLIWSQLHEGSLAFGLACIITVSISTSESFDMSPLLVDNNRDKFVVTWFFD